MSQPPKGISIGSADFAQYTCVINTQTDRQTHRPRCAWHLSQKTASGLCMRCGLKMKVSKFIEIM